MDKIKCFTAVIIFMISLPAVAQNPFFHESSTTCTGCNNSLTPRTKNLSEAAYPFEHIKLARVFLDENGKDPRKEVEPVGPYGTIGKIVSTDGNVRSTGTAFLVSPCHILTAAHSVLRDELVRSNLRHTFYFGKGLKSGTAARVADYGKGFEADKLGLDWALLELNECVGADKNRADIGGRGLGWMELPDEPNYKTSIRASVSGVYDDLQHSPYRNQLYIDASCELKRFDFSLWVWRHNCASLDGGSGGPLFVINNGVPLVYGINTGDFNPKDAKIFEKKYDEKYGNVAVNIFSFVYRDSFQKALESDPRVAGLKEHDNPLRQSTK